MVASTLQRVVELMREGASVIRRVVHENSNGSNSNELSLCSVFLSEDLESLTFVKEDLNLVSRLQLSGVSELAKVEEAEAPAISMRVVASDGSGESQSNFRLQIIFPSVDTRDVWFAGLSVLTDEAAPVREVPEDKPAISDHFLIDENRKLRRLLQARDATIADLMGMIGNLIDRQQSLLQDFAGPPTPSSASPTLRSPSAPSSRPPAPRAAEAAVVEESGDSASEADSEERLRMELEEKIAMLEEKKSRLENLLRASQSALEEQLLG